MKRILILLLMALAIASTAAAEGQALISWTDVAAQATHGPADHFIVWRAEDPDTGFVYLATTSGTLLVDADVPENLRMYYRVTSVRDYLTSDYSDWVSIRWVDFTDGRLDTERLVMYYPTNLRALLVVWPPHDNCAIIEWDYGLLDLLSIKCDPAPFPAPAMTIE